MIYPGLVPWGPAPRGRLAREARYIISGASKMETKWIRFAVAILMFTVGFIVPLIFMNIKIGFLEIGDYIGHIIKDHIFN